VRTPRHFIRNNSVHIYIAGLICILSVAVLVTPSRSAGQSTPPAGASSAPKPVEMPEGDGKAIATEYCQECHRLTNLTRAHKSLDDWKDTIHTMVDRVASIPDDKIDTLAAYLAKNFGPKDASAAPAADSSPATSSTPSSTPSPAAPAATAPGAPEAVKPVVELPEGEGKAIATENCQACHKLTNLTKAHKSLDDWKDTVQTMIDRGANVPADKVDTLVQYLAKNFGPKDSAAPAK
jgi:mono/diheme cytochrome c family protein